MAVRITMISDKEDVIIKLAALCVLFSAHRSSVDGASVCPIGFELAYTKDSDDTLCYRLKGPETFSENFDSCTDNLYTSKLYDRLNITREHVKLWAEYKTFHPGGVFIDWSYTQDTGDVLKKTFDVRYDPRLGLDDDLCTVLDDDNLTAVRCSDKYHRYCIVKPYDWRDDSSEGCEELQNYTRFFSPRATCLSPLTGVGGGPVRANWLVAQDLCAKKGGSLLQRGWRYADSPAMAAGARRTGIKPLGVTMEDNGRLLWVDSEEGNNEVAEEEWSFSGESYEPAAPLVALWGGAWRLVNATYTFYDVVCERSIHLRSVSLNLTVNTNGQIMLRVSDPTVDENKIWCFSDSNIFYPSRVQISRTDIDGLDFLLKPLSNGHYWCVHADSRNFVVSESNKILYIKDTTLVANLFVIKIRVRKRYSFDNLKDIIDVWTKKLSEFIFLRNKYIQANDRDVFENITDTLKIFKEENMIKNKDNIFQYLNLKRVYLDGRTALLHGQLNPALNLDAIKPGHWRDIEVLYMKPSYYCKGFNGIPTVALGNSTEVECRKYSCVGDFSEGVQWVTAEARAGCERRGGPAGELAGELDVDYASSDTPEHIPTQTNEEALNRNAWDSSSSEENIGTTTIESPPVTSPALNITTPRPATEMAPPPPPPTTERIPEEVTTTEQPREEVMTATTPPLEVNTAVTNTTHPIRPPPPTEVPTTTELWPPLSPEEHLQGVLDSLEQLLQADVVAVSDVEDAFDKVDELFDKEDDLSFPGQFLNYLDEIGNRADLNGSRAAAAVRGHVALLMADSGPAAPARALVLAARDTEAFTDDAFQILEEQANATHLSAAASEAVVQLPASLMAAERRISFVVFANDRAFRPAAAAAHFAVNSRVLSINVHNITSFQDGEVIDLHFRPVGAGNGTRACAYWHFAADGGGAWSQAGCSFLPATQPGLLDTCRCTHLTHFAEILVPSTAFSNANETTLEVLSIIGCVVSIVGLLLIGLTAAVFRAWRKEFSNKVWLQLCVAIFILVVCFLVVVFAQFEGQGVPCMLVGILLHYSVLASMCWMFIAAILSYKRLVLVFSRDTTHKLLKASAFSWGAPWLVIGVLLSVDPQAYSVKFGATAPSGSFCYPAGLALWLAVFLPIAVMLLANCTLYILILRSVFASRRIQRHGDANEALRCASVSCLLLFLFGLPWLFGLFGGNVVLAYFFTVTATFQGFVLFLFFVVGNKKTRELWLNKLRIKQTRKVPVTTSTYKSGSARGGRPGDAPAQPRSLASSDDSRFS